MPNAFTVSGSEEGGVHVLALDGFLDAHTAPSFEEAIQRLVSAGQNRIVVDCGKLGYISSAGLGVFMTFIEEIRDAGGDIKICSVAPKVLQVFEILGFNSLFDILNDVPQAIAKFAEGQAAGG